jgi:hypothetical protein
MIVTKDEIKYNELIDLIYYAFQKISLKILYFLIGCGTMLSIIYQIQRSVDEGHQPCRSYSEMVFRSEALNFGFNNADLKNLESIFKNREKWIIYHKVVHRGEEYLLILIKPIIGKGKIWELPILRTKISRGK